VESLRWAADYSRLNGDELVGVVAYSSPQSESSPDWYEDDIAKVRKQAASELSTVAPDVPCRVELIDGDPQVVIPDLVNDEGAAVVVVGARWSGGFHGLGQGNIARHLAHRLRTPLVIVPGMGGQLRGSPVVVGLDGSVNDVTTLEWAVRLAEAVGGSVSVVYASDPMARSYPHPAGSTVADQKEAVVRAQVAWAATPDVETTLTVEVDDPIRALTRVADQVDGSVIVVGRKGVGHLRGLMLGRVPARLPNFANRPVAIIPRGSTD
jgi:nucleotide-binding universal stress UspA family protein